MEIQPSHSHVIDWLIDWLIDWIEFYAVSAIFQPCNSGMTNVFFSACSPVVSANVCNLHSRSININLIPIASDSVCPYKLKVTKD